MPAINDIYRLIMTDSRCKRRYKKNWAEARRVADNIALVHVMRRARNSSIIQILPQYPNCELETSSPARSSPRTLYSEQKWSFPPSLYFYAGRAAPGKRYGYMALAFDKNCEANHKGTASTFDSGGLAHGYISTNLSNNKALEQFVAASLIKLDEWRRKGFARYLAAYFSSPADYFTGRPIEPDPEELHIRPGNTWRAWTFEVRFHENQKLDGAIKWCGSRGLMDGVRQTLIQTLPPYHGLHSFMRRAIIHSNRTTPVKEMERWVRNELKI
jgi:hypothetical protein